MDMYVKSIKLVEVFTAVLLISKLGLCVSTDVYLQEDRTGARLANNSVPDPNTVSTGITCCGSQSQPTWHYPNGTVIPEREGVIIAIPRSLCSELRIDPASNYNHLQTQDEGVYSCKTTDSIAQELYIGIYTAEGYSNSVGPVLSLAEPEPITFTLLSPLTHHPPTLSLHCFTTASPPTNVSWLLNGDDDVIGQHSSNWSTSQIIKDRHETSYDNVLTIENLDLVGRLNFTYIVGNIQGSTRTSRSMLAPNRPTNLNVKRPGDGKVVVSWSPTQNTFGYRVMYTNKEVSNVVVVNESTASNATTSELTAGVQYTISVQAFGHLPSSPSDPVLISLLALSAPTIVSVNTVSSTSLMVQWSMPAGPVTGYRISYTPVNIACPRLSSGRRVVEGSGAVHMLTGLQEGVEYEITVQARGEEAFGNISLPTNRLTANDVPSSPPGNVSVASHSAMLGITVVWSPPPCEHINSQDGLTGYSVRYRPQDSGQWVETVSITTATVITGLTMLELYEVQVAARNGEGLGPYSSSVTGRPIVTTPDHVTSLRADPDIVSIAVSWEPPVVARDGLVTGYEVCSRPADVQFLNCDPLLNGYSTQTRVRDLQPDSLYVVTVKAVIDGNKGPVEETMARTSAIGQVDGVRVTVISETSVNVSWVRLDSMDVIGYIITYAPVAGRKRQGPLNVRVSDSLNSVQIHLPQSGTPYLFQVRAVVGVNGLEMFGALSPVTPQSTFTPTESTAPGLVAALLTIALVITLFTTMGIMAVIYYKWRSGRSGHFDVTACSDSVTVFKPNVVPSRMPLPNLGTPRQKHSKPVIEYCPQDVMAEEGEQVLLVPRVSGTPQPTIAWYFEGRMLSSNYALEVGKDGSLTLVCVEIKHGGTYRFTASNSAGSVQGEVCVFVYGYGESVDGEVDSPTVTSHSVAIEEFAEYIEKQHDNNNQGFRDQYHSLPSGEDSHQMEYALSSTNKHLNRFTNIVAYDDQRVRLEPMSGCSDCRNEYINASYIDGYRVDKKFIATQGPLVKTIVDFWRMVWQTRPQMIVMITSLKEGIRVKCDRYWPMERGQSSDYGPFTVTFSQEKVYADFTVRTFVLTMKNKTQSSIKLPQFHYTSWPDHGVPDFVGPMLAFHRRITAEYRHNKGPILTHCSAGVGRTGTFIAIDIALEQVENENVIDIPAIVSKLRTQRMRLVQTEDQYVFIHDAVFESLTCGSTQIPGWELHTTVARLRQLSSYTGMTGYQHQFETLAKVTPKPGNYSSATAIQCHDRNRTMDNLPPERYRVILKAEHPDYIHASFVNGYRQKKAFIIAQGPLPNTCRDFWKMVYERNCSSIVMLSGLNENKRDVCYRYWPESGSRQYGEFVVGAIEQVIHQGYSERLLDVTDSKSGQTHRISQYQLSEWGSVGSRQALHVQQAVLLSVVDTVLSMKGKNGAGPIVVHCSDTVGSSCVFCAVAILTESCKVEGMVDIFQVVKAIRVQKPGAIPSVEQYEYIHNLLLTYLDSNNHSFRQL